MKRILFSGLAAAVIASITSITGAAQAATPVDLHAALCSAKASQAVSAGAMQLIGAENVAVGVAETTIEEISYTLPDGTRCDLLIASSEVAKAGKPVFVTYDYRITATRQITGYYPLDYVVRNGSGTNVVIPVGASFSAHGVALPAGTVDLASAVYATSATGQYQGASYTDNANPMTYNVLARAAAYMKPVRVHATEADKAAAQAVHDAEVAKAQAPVTAATSKVTAAKKKLAKAKAKVKKLAKTKAAPAKVKKAKKTLRKAKTAKVKAVRSLKKAKSSYAEAVKAADRRYAAATTSKVVDTEVPAQTSTVIKGTV